jgi:hypothetical protein
MSEQKSSHEGSCCSPKSDGKGCCCPGKKFFLGILTGLAIAVVAHCFMCGGGMCGMKSAKTCPIQMQAPAHQ